MRLLGFLRHRSNEVEAFDAAGRSVGIFSDQKAALDAKYVTAMIKCHVKSADAAVKGTPVDDEPCESNPSTGKGAKEKFDAGIAKLALTCSGCAITNAPTLRSMAETFLDSNNGLIYCAP